MANRRRFYQGQFPTNAELVDADDQLENADHAQATDWGFFGVVIGGGVAQAVIPNLTVVLAGPTVCYDQTGERIYVPTNQTINCAVDYLSVSTAVAVPGNKKYLSIFAVFARNPTDPRTDSETPPQTIYWNQAESFSLVVYQGAEGAAPAPPPLLSNGVLLCDVIINNTGGVPQVAIHTDGVALGGSPTGHDVDFSRSQLLYAITHANTWPGINATSLRAALTAISAELDNVTASGVLNYLGSMSTPHATGQWADASILSSQLTLGDALSAAVATLGNVGAGTSGALKVGAAPLIGASSTITPGSGGVQAALLALKSAANLDKGVGGTWANGDTTSASLLSTYLDTQIIGSLAASTGNGGTARIGGIAIPTLTTGATIAAGTLNAQLVALKSNVNLDAIALTGAGFNLDAGSVRSQLQNVADRAAPIILLDRPSFNARIIGTIAANTQLVAADGYVEVLGPAAGSFNIAMDVPAGGTFPMKVIKFKGSIGAGQNVYVTNTANLAAAPPIDYYFIWSSASSETIVVFQWNGTTWQGVMKTVSIFGGGTLAS